MAEKKSPDTDTQNFKHTLNLPRTDFPIRADSKINDPIVLERWQSENLYDKAMALNEGAEKFILHDGPPYANGNIHLGHAYNKILKDVLAKTRRMMGYHTPVVPGWDCHGLPIERRVKDEHPELTGAALKSECRAYAARWVAIQRDEFKALGTLMDWDHPYITMAPSYEADTLRAFGVLVEKGFVERKNKTIPWCSHCQTALASAEIEYQDKKDPSLYVLFELDTATKQRLFANISEPINFVIWTTTPWTIPLNRAVIVKPGAQYQLIELNGTHCIVGADLADALATVVGAEKRVLQTFVAEDLTGALAHHPLYDKQVPILFDHSVGLDEGTACVHSAPGCGPIDYELGVKNNLEIYSPLTPDGRYDQGIEPKELQGMSVADGQIWVIKALAHNGRLFAKKSITHSYPHCWRCHNPLMFRATPQWFCNLEHDDTKKKALAAIEGISFIPEQGKNFLRATVENRWEWCLSRQRVWGVPIAALLKNDGTTVYTSAAFVTAVAERVQEEGIEYWDRVTLEELILIGALPQDFPIHEYRKESDILDVWFDSGISHYAVLRRDTQLRLPADWYLEGIDQHRGWFQSSLLTSIILNGEAPMRGIMTHGFTVDEKGRKMSKSLGNVVSPQDIIGRVGTDGLRLWVAAIGNDGDAVVSDTLLQNVGEVFRKIRNTCRFLLQNLYDYDHAKDAVALDALPALDKYALRQLMLLQDEVLSAYVQGNLTAVFHLLSEYCTVELSSFYGDIIKDRLYCEQSNGALRRSAQTTLWIILDALTRLMAPVLSFTAELVSDHYQHDKKVSIHLQQFADLSAVYTLFGDTTPRNSEFWNKYGLPTYRASVLVEQLVSYDRQWETLKQIRSALLKLIETQRETGTVKHSLEVALTLSYDKLDDLKQLVGDVPAFLREFLIVSQVTLADSCDGLEPTAVTGLCARAEHAAGDKCPRCWNWSTQADDTGLCPRCHTVA